MTAEIEPSTVKTKHPHAASGLTLRTAGVVVPAHATGVNVLAPLSQNGRQSQGPPARLYGPARIAHA